MRLAVPTHQPDELGSIYEWYAARTTSAIRTSYAAATSAAGALLAYIHGGGQQEWTTRAFFLVIALALVACFFQHSELAQLPRERAAAMHLLAIFQQLADAKPPLLEAPIVQPLRRPRSRAESKVRVNKRGGGRRRQRTFILRILQRFWTHLCLVAVMALVLIPVVVLFYFAVRHEQSHLADAGLWLSAPVALVLAIRIAAEIRPSPELPDEDGAVEFRLDEHIGGVRLDDYVSDYKTFEIVNKHIKADLDKNTSAGVRPATSGGAS